MQSQKVSSDQAQIQNIPLAHNGQNSHNKRRFSKIPVRELPPTMPKYQHPIYPQLYCVSDPKNTCYKWDSIILDLDRTIIHGKRLSVKRWRKYVENGTIPSLAENQCSKWHRHIHRKGHQMHPFIRGRTMIYYRPFTWHLLAVLDYLKSHFNTKIIVCTKAGEHYAASVLAALISNFTSANPDLIDDVYNFHDLTDDEEEEGKPKKPFQVICERHNLDPKKTLIVDDNATSWFDNDRMMTNFWMPPCYGYQVHDVDNELQLLCKYLWDPVQLHHLNKKKQHAPSDSETSSISPQNSPKRDQREIASPHALSPRSSMTMSPKQHLSAKKPSIEYSTGSISEHSHSKQNAVDLESEKRLSRSYNKRKYNDNSGLMILDMSQQTNKKEKEEKVKTKKKFFFDTKSRGSKKLAKMIGK